MKQYLIIYLTLVLCLWGCERHDSSDDAYVKEVTPTTIVNLRTGPGQGHGKVRGLHPGEKLVVVGSDGEEWIEVTTSGGEKGYVASKYLEETGYKESGQNLSSGVYHGVDETAYTPHLRYKDGSLMSDYVRFVFTDSGFIFILILFAIQYGVCFWLKKCYNFRQYMPMYERKSAGWGIFAVIVSAAFTIFQIISIFSVREGASSNDFVFSMMILSSGLIMATVPWRLKISGYRNIHCMSSGAEDSRADWGGTLGTWMWTILIIPLAVFYIQSFRYIRISFDDDSFFGMVWTMAMFLLFTWVFCKYFWTYVVVKYMFKSMNSVLLGIVNCIMGWGIAILGYDMCGSSFNGIFYIISLWLLVLILMIDLGSVLTTVNEKRCGNCHTFEGKYTGTTDLGSSYRTEYDWKNGSDSMINRRHENSVISENRRLVRTTKRVDKWKTHHHCPNCYNDWDIDNSSETTVASNTVERRWKETYIE